MRKGQTIIEMLVAIGLMAVLVPGLLTGFVASRESKASDNQRLRATYALKGLEETTRASRDTSWGSLTSSSVVADDLTKSVVITTTTDPSVKKAAYSVSWTKPYNGSVSSEEYLTRFKDNQTKVHTTQADFDGGVKNNTETTTTGGGAIQLKPAITSGTLIDDYTTAADYSFDSSKIEVTGGYAQLLNLGGTTSGTTTNSGFNANPTGWTFVAYGTNFSQSGNYLATGGNPGGYINVNFPRNSNKLGGGYWYQGFTTTATNPTGTLAFNWRVTAYPTATTSLRVYAWLDTVATGTPVTQIWDSGNLTSTTAWSGTVSVNVAPYITTPGTYYLKVGAFINVSPGNKGPYTIGFDNVLLNWAGTGNSYATDGPTITEVAALAPTSVTAWSSFSTVEVTNGGTIRYQLSTNNGSTWQYWNGSTWATATLATDYNDATTLNNNITTLGVGSGTLKIKAFLVSNGSQWVRLDRVTVGYLGTGGNNSGTFVSATIDFGDVVGINRLFWTAQDTANTTTTFQVAVNTDNTTWNYLSTTSGEIPAIYYSGRYLRYQISFTSTNTDIPVVWDVTVNYSP